MHVSGCDCVSLCVMGCVNACVCVCESEVFILVGVIELACV